MLLARLHIKKVNVARLQRLTTAFFVRELFQRAAAPPKNSAGRATLEPPAFLASPLLDPPLHADVWHILSMLASCHARLLTGGLLCFVWPVAYGGVALLDSHPTVVLKEVCRAQWVTTRTDTSEAAKFWTHDTLSLPWRECAC